MKTKSIASLEKDWSGILDTKVDILLARNSRGRDGSKLIFCLGWIPGRRCYIVGSYRSMDDKFRLYTKPGDGFLTFVKVTEANSWARSGELVAWIRNSVSTTLWQEGPEGFLNKVKEYLE